jgi:hypothetical protein
MPPLKFGWLPPALQIVPRFRAPFEKGDVSWFRTSAWPLTPGAWRVILPPSSALPPRPTSPGQQPAPSLPDSITLYTLGPVKFRVIFEAPEPELKPPPGDVEAPYRGLSALTQPNQASTGDMIKGLTKNFLITTPIGNQITGYLTRLLGSAGGGETGRSLNFNIDLHPTPVLEGKPPMIMLNLEATW